jgi:hypothetical protein
VKAVLGREVVDVMIIKSPFPRGRDMKGDFLADTFGKNLLIYPS